MFLLIHVNETNPWWRGGYKSLSFHLHVGRRDISRRRGGLGKPNHTDSRIDLHLAVLNMAQFKGKVVLVTGEFIYRAFDQTWEIRFIGT